MSSPWSHPSHTTPAINFMPGMENREPQGQPVDPGIVRDFHLHSDVDADVLSQHHTLGHGPGQAMPGDNQLWKHVKGAWNSVITYNVDDIVSIAGQLWVAKATSLNASPAVGNFWVRML